MRIIALLAGISCTFVPPAPAAQEHDSFTELHARAKEVEQNLDTLRADFIETTESDLLAQPIVERGTMVAARPMRILLRYHEPEAKLLFIDNEVLRLTWPERGHRETLEIGKIQDAVDKYFYRASEKDLRGHFDIELSVDPDMPGTHRVDMKAKRKQVKKGLDRMQLWIADDSYYLVKMRLVYPDGAGGKTIELDNVRANVPVDEEEFIDEPPTATEEHSNSATRPPQ